MREFPVPTAFHSDFLLRFVSGVGHRELLRSTISFDDMAGMDCCAFGPCGLPNRKHLFIYLFVCFSFIYSFILYLIFFILLIFMYGLGISVNAGGGSRDAAWIGGPANEIRGVMGRQFPTGVQPNSTLPLFIPQYYRALDLVNNNSEKVDISVRGM